MHFQGRYITYPDAIAYQKIRIEDGHFCFTSRYKLEFAAHTISYTDLQVCCESSAIWSNIGNDGSYLDALIS